MFDKFLIFSCMTNISILILTLDEEANLTECLASCAWCDDIVVFDSHSTDRTVEIALAKGARVELRQFDNYAAQRNAALHSIQYRHNWVLMLDADERIPAALAEEIQHVIAKAAESTTLFRVRRKDHFFGRWLRRSSGYPTWFGRLVRPERVRVEREINEEFVTDGGIELLQQHLEHYPFSKGIAWWYERHNRYSSMEALATLTERNKPVQWSALLRSDPVLRRRSLKQLAYRLPARPLIVFLYLYVVRRGLLDGLPGLYYSTMRASYELMIDIKVRELRTRENQQPV
ncbi:MAG: glycosyltransferase family 2 protein [Steroidobacteraceae bacterium]